MTVSMGLSVQAIQNLVEKVKWRSPDYRIRGKSAAL